MKLPELFYHSFISLRPAAIPCHSEQVSDPMWGSQSWLQPAFSRRFRSAKTHTSPTQPAGKEAAGKIARPTAPLAAAILATAVALASTGCNRAHKVTVRETVEEVPVKTIAPVTLNMGDPKQEKQLISGFYGIEAGSWRWTAKDFAVSLPPPASAQSTTLVFALSIPQVVIDKLKSVTLSAIVNGTALAPETYTHDGQYEYKREVPSHLLTGNAARVEFRLNRAMPPAGGDARELGIVARSVGFQSK